MLCPKILQSFVVYTITLHNDIFIIGISLAYSIKSLVKKLKKCYGVFKMTAFPYNAVLVNCWKFYYYLTCCILFVEYYFVVLGTFVFYLIRVCTLTSFIVETIGEPLNGPLSWYLIQRACPLHNYLKWCENGFNLSMA